MKLVQKPRQLPQSTLPFPSHRLSACADLGRNITHADMAVGHPLHNQLLEAALAESHQILNLHAHLPGRPAQHRACRRAFVAVRRKGGHRPRCAVRNSQGIDVLPRHVAPSSQQKRTRRASLQTTGSQVQTRGAGRRGPKSMVPARLREQQESCEHRSLRVEARHLPCRELSILWLGGRPSARRQPRRSSASLLRYPRRAATKGEIASG